jgi:hypothetical protein
MQHNAQSEQAENEGAAIKRNTELQALDSARQQDQIAAQGAEEMNASARQAHADMAGLDAIAQEYGGGNSVDRTRTIQSIQADEQLATIRANARGGIFESAFQATAARERAQSQLRAIRTPSSAGTYLQIGAALTNSYTNYKGLTKAPPGTAKGPQ